MNRIKFKFAAILLATVLILAGCASPSPAAPPPTTPPPATTPPATTPPATTPPPTTLGVYEIKILFGMTYQPYFLEVPVGSTVTFIHVGGDDLEHPLGYDPSVEFTVSFSGSDILRTHTYNDPGDYMFFCLEHGDSGLLRVKP